MTSLGGAERVLEQFQILFPGAPIFTTVFAPDQLPKSMAGWDVRPSFLQRLPWVARYSRALLPLMPMAFDRFDLRGFDLVISMSSAFSKNVRAAGPGKNLCYCLTPPRYLWEMTDEYVRGPARRIIAAPARAWLRRADLASARRVDEFVAISHTVAARISRTYGRHAEVVYPPVSTERIKPNGEQSEDFYLVVARLVPYKRVDLAVRACTQLRRRLIVVGRGPERRRLEAIAGPSVEFVGGLADDAVHDLYARCRAFIFPGLEDFGITPVEAQSAGRPVIAFARGGAAETVVDGETGVTFAEQTVDALIETILAFERVAFDPHDCRRNALRFSAARFRREMSTQVEMMLNG
jgi:glycosyltransferase involved in cell wall biosynthesis